MTDRNKLVKEHIITKVLSGDLPPASDWHYEDAELSPTECIDLF